MKRPHTINPWLFGLALGLAPAAAFAQQLPPEGQRVEPLRRWSFGMQLGAGTMLHDFDHDGFRLTTPTVAVTPHLGLRVVGPLSVHLVAQYTRFVRAQRDLVCVGAAVGLSYEPRVGRLGQLRIDGDFGVFLPGQVARPGFDLGAAFEFNVGRALAVGPFVRFTHVWDGRDGFATATIPYTPSATQDTNSLHWWVTGVSFTLREPPKPPRPARPNPELSGPQRPRGDTP